MTSGEELPEEIGVLLALVGFDRDLAAHVAVALDAHRERLVDAAPGRWHEVIGRLGELVDAARFLVDKTGQTLGGRDLPVEDRGAYLLGAINVARLLGVCQRTLRRRVEAEELEMVRSGVPMFTREAVLAYVVRNTVRDRSGS